MKCFKYYFALLLGMWIELLVGLWTALLVLILMLCFTPTPAPADSPAAPPLTSQSTGAQIVLQDDDKQGTCAAIPDGKEAFLMAPDHHSVLDVQCWVLQQDNTVAILDREDGSLITTIDGSKFGFTNTKEKHGNL